MKIVRLIFLLLPLAGAQIDAKENPANATALMEGKVKTDRTDQDRTIWDRAMISREMFHLDRAAVGDAASEFHLQAGIAACHCAAPTYDETDWPKILFLYDLLLERNDSPVIALNCAVAVGKVRGPEAGLTAVKKIKNQET